MDTLQDLSVEISGYSLSIAELSAEGSFWESTLWEGFAQFSQIWRGIALAFCFFWIVALIWVLKDAAARSNNLGFQFFSGVIIIILTPIFGLPLYIACRPQGFKRDKTIWRQAMMMHSQICSNCDALNPLEYSCCSECGDALKHSCRECDERYSLMCEYCPYCGAPNIEK